jgi:hypothetical protein
MALANNDARILQEIVDLDGNCMDSKRCQVCPFKALCLPEFLFPNPPTIEQRAKMALDVMTHHALADEDEVLDVKEHRWDKR